MIPRAEQKPVGETGAKLAFVNESAVVFRSKVIIKRGQAMKNAWEKKDCPSGAQIQILLKVSNLGIQTQSI